jgi:uncharacterized iron-regulated membrane protein
VKAWLRVHKWTSLLATLVLLFLCLTGLPLIFTDELSGGRSTPDTNDARSTAARTLDEIVAQPREAARRFVQFIFWQDESPSVVGLGVAPVEDAALEDVRRELVGARRAEVFGRLARAP